jgi:hypothetical protein
VLRREIVALGLALLLHQRGLLARLVHVVRDGAHVVEELRVHRPLLVLVPDRVADDLPAQLTDRVGQRQPSAAVDDVAESLVRRAVVVGGGRGRSEPPLVDAAAVEAEGVQVVGVELEPLARLEE